MPLRGLSTLGQGQGEGSAGDKSRVSGTQETVEGAGANDMSGVLSEASCCRCGTPLIKNKRPTLFSRPLSLCLVDSGGAGCLAGIVVLFRLETYIGIDIVDISLRLTSLELDRIDKLVFNCLTICVSHIHCDIVFPFRSGEYARFGRAEIAE